VELSQHGIEEPILRFGYAATPTRVGCGSEGTQDPLHCRSQLKALPRG
jgi:hypothetical protein